jgi:hypothetical protein
LTDFEDSHKRIERLLANAEPRMAAAFLRMVRAIRSKFTLNEIARFIETGSMAQALDTALRSVAIIGEAFVDEFVAAARETAAFFGRSVREIQIVFNQTNNSAVAAMQSNQLRLVRGFTDEQRELVRQILVDGIRRGLNPLEIAREFKNSIGLTPYQLQVVANYRRSLESLSADALSRELRDRRFDPQVRRAILSDEPLTRDQIERMVQRYHERMLAHRAEVIARTEALRAVNQGTQALYLQAVEEGTLDPNNMERIWNTAADERVRGSHRPMNGQERGIDEPFESGLGNQLRYPGDENAPAEEVINCRCVVSVRIKSILPEALA